MATITVDIKEDKDLPIIKAILTRFGLTYKVVNGPGVNKAEEKLLKKLKQSFNEINDWEAGKVKLQNAQEAIAELEAELKNGI
ncbi:MAG TPA: hypothetical protein VHE59_00705 [Mucilaginibacter sp.]|nr:hypothetical protein [Mucilaginibacter sp.]